MSTQSNKTAVVILNYNGLALLREFLPSVIRFSHGARIIVADNHSSDGSPEVVLNEFPGVDLIRIPENLGFCGGYNFALSRIDATYFVLVNSDVEVTSGWLTPVVRLLDEAPDIAAVQPKILSYRRRTQFEYAGAAGGFLDTFGYPFCRGRIFDSLEEDLGQFDDVRPVFWSTGACMFVRAAAFKDLGGFDEDFFAHMEEIDLCWRIQRAGFKIFYCGESTVYHVGGATLAASNPRKTYLNFRNGLSLIFKHLSTRELIWKFPFRVWLDGAAATKFLLTGYPKDCLAVLRAHMSFVGGLSNEIAKRKQLRERFGIPPRGLLYRGSIVFDYFIRGIRKFKALNYD